VSKWMYVVRLRSNTVCMTYPWLNINLYFVFFRYGICFVSGLYCFAVGVILFLMFINDIYMVSLGITYHEWQEQCKDFKGDCRWFLSRHVIRNVLPNWRAFFNNVWTLNTCFYFSYIYFMYLLLNNLLYP